MGCAFYARNAVINLNGYFESLHKVDIPKIFTLDYSESDVIFGNSNRIMEAIKDIKVKYCPKVIFLFNCCVSEIVGSDIDEIADSIDDVVVIPIHTAGFKGDHKYGMKMASQIICDHLMPEIKTKTNNSMINILGEFDYFNRSTQELTDRLNKIGITRINHIPGKSTLKEIQESASATLNIITCHNASRHLAELMKDKYGIPYIGYDLSLYGINNTFRFYEQIYEFFHVDTTPLQEEKTSVQNEVSRYTQHFKNKTAAVIAGTRRAIGYSSILKELGLDIVLLFSEADNCYTKEQDFHTYSNNLFINEYSDYLTEEIKKSSPDVIFTTLPEMVAPEKYLSRLSDDFAGFSGAIRMAKYLYSYFADSNQVPVFYINE